MGAVRVHWRPVWELIVVVSMVWRSYPSKVVWAANMHSQSCDVLAEYHRLDRHGNKVMHIDNDTHDAYSKQRHTSMLVSEGRTATYGDLIGQDVGHLVLCPGGLDTEEQCAVLDLVDEYGFRVAFDSCFIVR